MKIGIIGTRGIPNNYGGFEQFAEHFSIRMAERGHDVSVYTSHKHSHQSAYYKNVRLIHCYDPEYRMGTAGQFLYDFNCIRDSRKQDFDIILQLGYTSSTIWSWLYPAKPLLVTNMDGLEWQRAKYSKATQYFLTYAEKWGVRHSDYLIADSKGIQDYLEKKYDAVSYFVAYGAPVYTPHRKDQDILSPFFVSAYKYDLVVARFEPENNIETILSAYAGAPQHPILLIGNYAHTAFGRKMYNKYAAHTHIIFAGAVFDTDQLNALRYYSRLYYHGHSAGGTNPSLLEAMGCQALICAHDNIFNKYILGEDAFYFKKKEDISSLLASAIIKQEYENYLDNNKEKILHQYNWEQVTEQIETHFKEWIK